MLLALQGPTDAEHTAVGSKIPCHLPDFLSGVINLRGNVVPVMDLGQKLGMTPIKETINSSIVIVQLMTENDTVLMSIGLNRSSWTADR